MRNLILVMNLLFLFAHCTYAQQKMPVLKTNNKVVSIKDGNELRSDYWTIDPEIKLDVYTADKTSKIKTVAFYSDIDTIAFELNPREKYDFIILLNDQDTCYTQIKSGITFNPNTQQQTLTSDTIPFTLTPFNNIVIQTIINQVDTVDLMFHTAVSSVGLTKAAIEKTSSLNMGKEINSNSWGGGGTTRYSRNNSLEIGEFKWDNITISEGLHSGKLTDGKFGPNLFKDKIIEINYEKELLIIHSKLPEINNTYEKLDLVFKQDWMFITGKSFIENKPYNNQFLIHSGYSGTILYDDAFVRTNKMGTKLKTIKESELKDSYGNVLKTKKVLLPTLNVGTFNFSEIPVGIFEGAIAKQKMSVVGGDVLKRFHVILDLQNAYIYLQPNKLMNLPYADS